MNKRVEPTNKRFELTNKQRKFLVWLKRKYPNQVTDSYREIANKYKKMNHSNVCRFMHIFSSMGCLEIKDIGFCKREIIINNEITDNWLNDVYLKQVLEKIKKEMYV